MINHLMDVLVCLIEESQHAQNVDLPSALSHNPTRLGILALYYENKWKTVQQVTGMHLHSCTAFPHDSKEHQETDQREPLGHNGED